MQQLKQYRKVFLSHILTVQVRCSFWQQILLMPSFKNWDSTHLQYMASSIALLPAFPGHRKEEEPVGEIYPLLKSLTSHSAGEKWTHGPTHLQRGGSTATLLLLGCFTESSLSAPISLLFHCPQPGARAASWI